ncbi:MAG: AAA family ATPase [Gammaproteobacteria bacterium HGW-Gammaproteobacteria-14]|nr:MAG: AAA family ATPase [Gammaproteobacteria bacterium HGW-Gammaproteobacteria-14]
MSTPNNLTDASALAAAIESTMATVVVGQQRVVREVLITLISGGHILLEGVPGLGKTLLVRTLARCLDINFARIQFTPDLMPTDVTGHAMFDQKTEQFRIRKGPAFTQLLLADEINRASAKTQSSLLEVMQERQITIEGKCFPLQPPFMVLATQNPLDQEGTYPLPEAELDRFLLKSIIDYPEIDQEARIVRMVLDGTISDSLSVEGLEALTNAEGVMALQKLATTITLDEEIVHYALRIVRSTRSLNGLARGAGPRASIALCTAGRAEALLQGRDYVIPDDIKSVANAVLRHRIQLSADAEIEGQTAESLLDNMLNQVAAPRQ